MDSDDNLEIPPRRPPITLDDSDDDLPPPAALAQKRSLPTNQVSRAAAATATQVKAQSGRDTELKPTPGSPLTFSSGQKDKRLIDPQSQFPPSSNGKTKNNPSKVYKEGFLFKQQPSWPYSNQKRYCVLKNCKLYYFDSQESMKEGKPQGVIELTNASLTDPGNEAKLPFNFGVHVDGSDRQAENGGSGNRKQRTFIFAVAHAHELGEWKSAIQAVVGDPLENENVHWFEKMVQGTY